MTGKMPHRKIPLVLRAGCRLMTVRALLMEASPEGEKVDRDDRDARWWHANAPTAQLDDPARNRP